MTNAFDTALTDIFSALGAEATFTPASGDAVPGVYVSLELSTEVQSADTAGLTVIMPTIEYIIDDLGGEAVKGDTFLITDEDSPGYDNTYTVCERVQYDGRAVMVTVK